MCTSIQRHLTCFERILVPTYIYLVHAVMKASRSSTAAQLLVCAFIVLSVRYASTTPLSHVLMHVMPRLIPCAYPSVRRITAAISFEINCRPRIACLIPIKLFKSVKEHFPRGALLIWKFSCSVAPRKRSLRYAGAIVLNSLQICVVRQ